MNRSCVCIAALLLCAIMCRPLISAQASTTKPALIEIPFEFIRGSIVIQATVNGHGPFWMMLDSGADPSVVDLEMVKSMGLTLAAEGQQGAGGGTDVNLVRDTNLSVVQLGGLTATHVDAVGTNLSKLSSALGRPIAGVLGYSLLKTRIVQIDYPNRKVRFYRTAPSCPGTMESSVSKCTTLPFRYKDDIVATGVTINGRRMNTNVDTGSNANFQITPAAVDKLGLAQDVERAHGSSSVGFNGALKNREGTVRNITVGTISANEPSVVFFGKGMGLDQEPWDLRIGSGFLKDYVVTLDFQLGCIMLALPVR